MKRKWWKFTQQDAPAPNPKAQRLTSGDAALEMALGVQSATGRNLTEPEPQYLPARELTRRYKNRRPELGYVIIKLFDGLEPTAPWRVPADRVAEVLTILLDAYDEKDVPVRISVIGPTTAASCRLPFYTADFASVEAGIVEYMERAGRYSEFFDENLGQGRR